MVDIREALLIDATCPPDVWIPQRADWIEGGFSACVVSVGGTSPSAALARTGRLLRVIEEDPRLVQVTDAAGIRAAARAGLLGVMLHFQSTAPFGDELANIQAFQRLGIRMVGLAYNRRNLVCDGCEEPADAGLSIYGQAMIAEMNRVGILVDFAHTGWRSSREALTASTKPCIASHSNAHAVHAHPRNLPDDVIAGIADSGGIIGVNGFPAFVSTESRPTLDSFIDHIVHIDTLVGSGHVGLGMDRSTITTEEYGEMIADGDWSADNYPPPPWHWPTGLETARSMRPLVDRLGERGYRDDEIVGVLGGNWARLFDKVWGA